jgi:hypothetical protein
MLITLVLDTEASIGSIGVLAAQQLLGRLYTNGDILYTLKETII